MSTPEETYNTAMESLRAAYAEEDAATQAVDEAQTTLDTARETVDTATAHLTDASNVRAEKAEAATEATTLARNAFEQYLASLRG